MENKIIEIVSFHTDVKLRQIKTTSHLQADLGMTSLEIANAMVDIENKLGVKIDDALLPRIQTVADLIAAAEGRVDDMTEVNDEYSMPIQHELSDAKDTVLVLGDSTGSPIWLDVRKNAYGPLLARRLGLECLMRYTIGADTTVVLNNIMSDNNLREEIKNARIIIFPIGGNNIFAPYLNAMAYALGMKSMDIRLLPLMDKAYKENSFNLFRMGYALLSNHTFARVKLSLQKLQEEMVAIVNEVRRLNPNAIIITQSAVNPFYRAKVPLEHIMKNSFQMSLNKLNKVLREANYGDIFVDIERDFRLNKKAPKYMNADLTADDKLFDPHFNQLGHVHVYEMMYDALVAKYPQYASPAPEKLLLTRADLEEEEIRAQEEESFGIAKSLGLATAYEQQPADFSDGPLQEYNWWFNFALFDTYFHPVKKVTCHNEGKLDIEEMDFVFPKAEGENDVALYDRAGNRLGKIFGDTNEPTNPSIRYALDNQLKVFVRVFKPGDTTELLYVVFPKMKFIENTEAAR